MKNGVQHLIERISEVERKLENPLLSRSERRRLLERLIVLRRSLAVHRLREVKRFERGCGEAS